MLPDTPRHRRMARLARAGYAVVICLATLSNLGFEPNAAEALLRLRRALGMDWLSMRAVIVDGVRNVVLFAGFGAVWVVTSRRPRARVAVLGATVVGAAMSLFVESVQLFSPLRFASVLDFITNAGGAAAGAAIVVALVELLRRARGRRSFVGIPAFTFAASYLATIFGEAVAPGFQRLIPPDNLPGLRDRFGFMVRLWLGDPAAQGVPWTEAVLAIPAGALLAAAVAELGAGYGTASLLSAAGCIAVAFAAQALRAAGGQPIDTGAFIAHALGGVAGAALAWRGLAAFTRGFRGRARPGVLLAAYTAVVAVWSLRPFVLRTSGSEIVEQFTLQHWIPLAMLGGRLDIFSVADVTGQFFLLLPVGALLGVWPLRHRGPLRTVLPAVWIAFGLELAQAVIVDRFFDVTDPLIRIAGAAVGWVVVRQAGYAPYGEVLGAGDPPASRPVSRPPPRASARIHSRP